MSEILFLAHRIPFPPDRGDKIRSFNIVKRLSELARVHVAAFADDAADAGHEGEMRKALGSGVASSYIEVRRRSKAVSLAAGLAGGRSASMAAFSSAGMRRHVSTLLDRTDIGGIFAFSGQMGQYVTGKPGKRRFVMDFVDVDSAKFESYAADARAPLRWLYWREAAQLAKEEARIARRSDLSLFVSEAEAALFRARTGLGPERVQALENGVDLAYFNPAATFASLTWADDAPLIVFTGQMDYPPNIAAAVRTARSLMPAVRAEHSEARFHVVGRAPAAEVRALEGIHGTRVWGEVPDVRPFLAAADLVAAPLAIARGVQNKVLEAMAMARPVLLTPGAAAGIEAVDGEHLAVAATNEQLVRRALDLLAEGPRALAMGAAARRFVVARKSWAAALSALPAIMGRDGGKTRDAA